MGLMAEIAFNRSEKLAKEIARLKKRIDKTEEMLDVLQPITPIEEGNEQIHIYRCRKCNRILQRNNEMNFCPKCGQAVKWQ